MQARCIAAALLLFATAAAAQDFKGPRISYLPVDWTAAFAELRGSTGEATADADTARLKRLNAAAGKLLPRVADSPIPVLLPVTRETARAPADKPGDVGFLPEFGRPAMFQAGPAGYDAAFYVTLPEPPRSKSEPRKIELLLSGFALLYDIGPRAGGEEKPPIGLQAEFPGIRRFYFEGQMRYLFSRYGALYALAVECLDTGANSRRLTCQEVQGAAERFLKALSVAGGTPQQAPQTAAISLPNRPESVYSDFAYYDPGDLIPGTGARQRGGNSADVVFAALRFPLAESPAQIYSQVFMDVGDCTQALGDSEKRRRNGAPFRCPDGDSAASAGTPSGGPYNYPWRDNFCELRSFNVGQCPAGFGHQGEDISPVDCRLYSRDLSQCERKEHPVVAARDGMVLRAPGQASLTLVSNAASEHILFRYLHMNPKLIDADGFFSGRAVREGETIGRVGNYAGREAGTSYHLHFDMQVPTNDGWSFVNPYMSLVLAYERLIGHRGIPIPDVVRDGTIAGASLGSPVNVPEPKPMPASLKHKSRPRHR